MAEDQSNKEEKFDFTPEGEALGYISLDQAQVLAMRTARETPGAYGSSYTDVPMAFEVVEAEETEDHYTITLSFRPQGEFTGTTGQEQFFIEKEGNVALRQVLALPRRRSRFPFALVAIGLVVVAGLATLAAVFVVSGTGGGPEEPANAAALPPAIPIPTITTPLPAPTEAPVVVPPVNATPIPTPTPTATLTPTAVPTITPVVIVVTATPEPTPRPTPTAVVTLSPTRPRPTPTPAPTATALPAAVPLMFTLGELNESGQSGDVTLKDLGNQTRVTLILSPGALNSQLVHIHTGQCGDNLGGVAHVLASFSRGSGLSTTTIEAPLSELQDGDHAINAHQEGNPAVYTACGNIPTGSSAGKIAFQSNRDGNLEIYVMNTDGSDQTRLTFNDDFENLYGWTASGDRIVFNSSRDGRSEIYVMNTDGSDQTRLTFNDSLDDQAAWSPVGDRIAFVSSRDETSEIYVMNADGSDQTRLTFNGGWNPTWSPTGDRIAFVSDWDGNDEIYVMNADGTRQTRLTFDNADDFPPVWSPDGTRIAFMSWRDGNAEIYVMSSDGTSQTRLTFNDADDWNPSWSR